MIRPIEAVNVRFVNTVFVVSVYMACQVQIT